LTLSNASRAGAAFFVGSLQFIIATILAEAYYPGYSVSTNPLSDLGGGASSTSAAIWNSSIIALGLLVILGALFLQKSFRWWPLTAMLALAGIGAIGVGVFPEGTGLVHALSELFAFLFGGLAAVLSYRFQRKPMSYFSLIVGALALIALVLYLGNEYVALGEGGMQRLVAYPELLWGVGFGAHLMAMDDPRL
jgi:hypothetical membrane protein